MVNADVHACALFSMEAAIEFERSLVVSLTSGVPIFEGAEEYVLSQLAPMHMLEGPSTIQKNSAGMGSAPQAVMFPPNFLPHIK